MSEENKQNCNFPQMPTETSVFNSSFVQTNYGNNLRDNSLQFQIDNEVGNTLKLSTKDNKYFIDLVSKRGKSIGQVSFSMPQGSGSSITRVTLDSINKRMVFFMNDRSTVYCNLSPLYRLIDEKQDPITDLSTIRANAKTGKEAKEILDEKSSSWDNKSKVTLSSSGTSENKVKYITVDNVEYNITPDFNEVQEKLVPGRNIEINGNEISAKDTVYYAGNGININYNNVISVTSDSRDYEQLNNKPSINGITLIGALLGPDLKLDVITYMTYREYLEIPHKERKLYFVCKNSRDLFAENCWRIYLQNKLIGEWDIEGGMVTLPKFPMRFPFRFA